MFQDRRKYSRTKEFVRLRIGSETVQGNFVTTDISPTGAFFAAAKAPAEGEELSVTVRPEGMKVAPIIIDAIVVRTVISGGHHQPGFAVRWLVARSEAGAEPLFRVLKKVLHVPEVTVEMFGHERDVAFVFPEIDAEFDKVLQIDKAPRGPLLQTAKEDKKSGPPKAPPPVQSPLETPSLPASETPGSVAPSAPRSALKSSSKPSSITVSATARAHTFAKSARRSQRAKSADDIMLGAGALRHRDSDTTVIGGRSKSLTARRDSGSGATTGRRSDVTIIDDIRIAPIGAVGKSRIDKLVEQAAKRESAAEPKANVGERSQIFGKSARLSSLGGRSMSTTIRGGADQDVEHASVKVDLPITYELDNRFVPARLVQLAPLALEVVTKDQVPQLDQNVTINMPVLADELYRTVYVMGKLLRLPEETDDGHSFVFHIERVHEGDFTGAFANFIAAQQQLVAE